MGDSAKSKDKKSTTEATGSGDVPRGSSDWRDIVKTENKDLANAAKKSLEERFVEMLETGHRSDLTVVVGTEKKVFKVHKPTLDLGSPVLKLVIAELEDGEELLELEDVDADAFFILLKHFYLKSEVEVKDALSVLKVAQDFMVEDLINECIEVLEFGITEKNILAVYNQAQAVDLGTKDLAEKTLEIICINAFDILDQTEVGNLSKAAFKKLLGNDDLNAASELQVFQAVLRWAKAECIRERLDPTDGKNIRKALEDMLNLIRFPVMDSEVFALNVATHNILNLEEVVAVLMYFSVSPEKRGSIPSGRFNSSPRNYAGSSRITVDIYPPLYAATTLETMEIANSGLHEESYYFTTPDISLYLTGLNLFGLKNGEKGRFTYTLRRVQCGTGVAVCTYWEGHQNIYYVDHEIVKEGQIKVYNYNFKAQREITFPPIRLEKKEQYRITVNFQPETEQEIQHFKYLRVPVPFFAPRAYEIISGDLKHKISIGRQTLYFSDGRHTKGLPGAAVQALRFRV